MNARRHLALACALSALVAGCSDLSQPTLAEPREAAAVIATGLDLTGVLQFAQPPSLGSRHAEKLIRAADGGFVELNGFRVDIPAGALSQDMTITIDLPSDGTLSQRLIAEFGPHGTQFNTPVTLTFPLTGVLLSGNPIEVARWENGAWTSLGGSVNTAGTALSGTTPHFSTSGGKYVLAGG